ncbi:hypothetical protein FC50_GL001259 [Lacticaseibacillus pantheris DSM 15945 = JCM 12539 = NBRC 106106]|uniref:Uncharacterized protein n=1 Tax=Lacticaseibacillus pantheris DSM 15945 = JCM 12539 = NBRC 106106 TaxID=1423783 RepID=A0A0R1U3Q5_9LACO|nr:hypothetical protein FC50_GL001259 [Lacticaseibacillus pantheris DSM 15945 = JCM 12539 = NBRC 106106]
MLLVVLAGGILRLGGPLLVAGRTSVMAPVERLVPATGATTPVRPTVDVSRYNE